LIFCFCLVLHGAFVRVFIAIFENFCSISPSTQKSSGYQVEPTSVSRYWGNFLPSKFFHSYNGNRYGCVGAFYRSI